MRTRMLLMVLCAAVLAGCGTVRVHTEPGDAQIEANGEDISDTGVIEEGPGFADHKVTVRRRGYAAKTVMVPRDSTLPWLTWTSLAGSVACAAAGGLAGCALGACVGNRNALPGLAGVFCGSAIGIDSPARLLLRIIVVNVLTPDWLTLPCMAMGTCAGMAPLVGLAVPLLFPHARDDVEITLVPGGESR